MVLGSLKKLPKYLGSKNVAMANSSLWLCFQCIWIHWSWHSLELVWKLKMRENQNKTVAGYRTDSSRVSADTDTHADTPSIGRYRYRYPGIGRTLDKSRDKNDGRMKEKLIPKHKVFGKWFLRPLLPKNIIWANFWLLCEGWILNIFTNKDLFWNQDEKLFQLRGWTGKSKNRGSL